jgi:peptide/nickel transport system substrate-binding protein
MRARRTVRFACAAIVAAMLTGPAPAGSQDQHHEWTNPNVVRFAVIGDPNSLNPLLAQSTNDTDIDTMFASGLIGVDETGKIFPQLAVRVPTTANGDISADGKTITYRLRHNVKWHDGAPFTSKDVRFSWQAVMNPANNVASRSGFDVIDRVDLPDAYTAVLRLKHPYGPMLLTFFCGNSLPTGLVPEHVLGKFANINQVEFNQKPIGTGPYKVLSWNHGRSVELEANPDYYLGKPKIPHISVRIVPSTTTIGIQLRTHELDIAELDSATYRYIRNDPAVRIVLAPQYVFVGLFFNIARPAFSDLRVRQAVAFALDRKGIVERTTFGTGELATGDIPSLSWAHATDVATYPYDPARAAKLLDEAGWKVGADGIRTKDGQRLSLDLGEIAGGTTGHGQDVDIQANMKAVGIDVQIKSYAPALFYAPMQEGGIVASGKFDMVVQAWVQAPDPDNSSLWMCKYVPPAGQNYGRYCNKNLDADEERAIGSYDEAVRKPIYAKIERQLTQDLAAYFLYYPKRRIGMNPDLKGVKFNGVTSTWNTNEWSY